MGREKVSGKDWIFKNEERRKIAREQLQQVVVMAAYCLLLIWRKTSVTEVNATVEDVI